MKIKNLERKTGSRMGEREKTKRWTKLCLRRWGIKQTTGEYWGILFACAALHYCAEFTGLNKDPKKEK